MSEFRNGIDGRLESVEKVRESSISPEAASVLDELFKDDFDGMEIADLGKKEDSPIDVWQEMGNLFAEDIRDLRTPVSGGSWTGERGNSVWVPDGDYVPPEKSKNPDEKPYSNPENKTWSEILEKYGIEGIEFKNGYPDFEPVSKGTVEISDFKTGKTEAQNENSKKADIELAKQKGCSPEDVEKWRKENNYTWHECEDKKTMQKVPQEVHANVPHDGGRSQE
jgi:hypothetical protein